jgi:ribosomal 30S subunit maturation factor RimM
LSNEKKRVKNELKVYDNAFLAKFNRIPSRSEKEPMRNLYMYYKRLKQAIVKK